MTSHEMRVDQIKQICILWEKAPFDAKLRVGYHLGFKSCMDLDAIFNVAIDTIANRADTIAILKAAECSRSEASPNDVSCNAYAVGENAYAVVDIDGHGADPIGREDPADVASGLDNLDFACKIQDDLGPDWRVVNISGEEYREFHTSAGWFKIDNPLVYAENKFDNSARIIDSEKRVWTITKTSLMRSRRRGEHPVIF